MYFKQLICCLSECGFGTTSVSACRASCVGIKEEFQAGRPFMLGSTLQLTLEETCGFGLTVDSQPPRLAHDGQHIVVGACGKETTHTTTPQAPEQRGRSGSQLFSLYYLLKFVSSP